MHQDRALKFAKARRATVLEADMALRRFRVTNFRSVIDSGWVELGPVNALIGVNESGKTNLLMPLWKLNPARGGEIEPTSDFPKALFATIRDNPAGFQFIEAEFDCGARAAEFAAGAGISEEEAATVRVGRFYDGSYVVTFPRHRLDRRVPSAWADKLLADARDDLDAVSTQGSDRDLSARAGVAIDGLRAALDPAGRLGPNDLIRLRDAVAALLPPDARETSPCAPILEHLRGAFGQRMAELCAADPGSRHHVRQTVLRALPPFVYYSNYGNLDSEIYLPHVVENMLRDDLGAREAAKARTLKVLFGFVGLKPEEVLELGRDFRDIREAFEAETVAREGFLGHVRNFMTRATAGASRPDAAELARIAEAKRTRSILMQSAGTKLTERFAEWWKQGDYRFRFEADGNHFRIWVADKRRPQEVELESRSTGLQWFLSFFLVFMVESMDAHRRAVLLLDEPGQSLHPLAQRDLSAFFDNLARTNQLVYTAHSPFLVDADRLDRVRKVYVAADGSTRSTADLREAEGSDEQAGAAYAVRAALTLGVAEAMLWSSRPVLVAGLPEQLHLGTIRTLLTAAGRIAPRRDLVFAPAGASRIAETAASLMAGRDGQLPLVLLAGDPAQRAMADELRAGLYATAPGRVLDLSALAGPRVASVEDLFPPALLADQLDRLERRPEVRLGDVVTDGAPFLPQVETWAAGEGLTLRPDWRGSLARRTRERVLDLGPDGFDPAVLALWTELFAALLEDEEASPRRHAA
jgi:predicted ATPase